MRSVSSIILIILAGILIIAMVGCSNDDDNNIAGNNNTQGAILSVYPADGSVNVAPSTPIAVKFSEPMDTTSVMNNFYLSHGEDMHMWMDSASHYGGMGHMSMNNMNHMMNWMDSIDVGGTFHWNDTQDSCEFIPDSGFMSNEEYMIMMYEGGMERHGGGMMMDHNDEEYHQYHFMTGP